ncbi:MAG TPA: O-antigen ligase family protein, partial [bacterium]|nr:O-antigen ligase family protein [bacterium]
QATAAVIADRPFIGCGLGTINQALTFHLPYLYHFIHPSPEYVIEHAHSELLEWWAETGSVGIILLLFCMTIFCRLLIYAQRLPENDRLIAIMALAAGAGALVHGLLETKLRYESTAVPLLAILASAVAPLLPASRVTASVPPRPVRTVTVITVIAAITVFLQSLTLMQANRFSKQRLDSLLSGQSAAALSAAVQATRLTPNDLSNQYSLLLLQSNPDRLVRNLVLPATPSGPLCRFQDAALYLSQHYAQTGHPEQAMSFAHYYRLRYPRDLRARLQQADITRKWLGDTAALALLSPSFYDGTSELQYQCMLTHASSVLQANLFVTPVLDFLQAHYSADTRFHLLAARYTFARHDLAGMFHHLCAALPADTRNLPVELRAPLEQLVNALLTAPPEQQDVLLSIGDILYRYQQFPQAAMVYQAALRTSIDPFLPAARLGVLG